MFDFLLGWRKASKCKRVVKQLQCRLKLLKNKKYAISSHLRHDIAQLLRIGERSRALNRAQHLFQDENLMSLYHSLLHFSDSILLHLSYIRRHRDLPDGINEAVSTLVFASTRCGDLPELRTLRLLFLERYGQPFVSTALHLLPGNRVNPQITETLSITSVSDDDRSKLLAEIAAEHGLRLQVLALEYPTDFHKQGDRIQAFIKGNLISKYEKYLQEGDCRIIMNFEMVSNRGSYRGSSHPYKINLLFTTYVKDCEDIPNLPLRFNFTKFSDISAGSPDENVFFDNREAEKEKEAEVDKFTLTEKQEESRSKSSRDQRKVCDEDECIEEEVLEKGQRVFRFKETQEERKERKRSRRRSRSASSSPMAKDVECWRYYYRGRRRHQKKECGQCYHIVYNVFRMWPDDQKEKRQGERGLKEAKHVHPKLPDYDQIAAHFTALRRRQQQMP